MVLGFRAAASHTIVDMQECLVLTPALVELARGLRAMLNDLFQEGGSAELHLTEIDVGFDLALRWSRRNHPALTQDVAKWAGKLRLLRVTSNGEIVASLGEPLTELAGTTIRLPPEAFLQPTREGEQALQALVSEAAAGARSVLDLFAGCGTFTLALARKARVHAVEQDAAMLDALGEAVRHATKLKPVTTERRDLNKHPLTTREVDRFDLVVLDPPRAGAARQVAMLARATLDRIVYVSCDAETFSRDARVLVEGGFQLRGVTPIDQFLWSDHIELVGIFER